MTPAPTSVGWLTSSANNGHVHRPSEALLRPLHILLGPAVVVYRELSHHLPVLLGRQCDALAVHELPEHEWMREPMAQKLDQLVAEPYVDRYVELLQLRGLLSQNPLETLELTIQDLLVSCLERSAEPLENRVAAADQKRVSLRPVIGDT
ncbi:hypothetical protein RRF57_013385 [Xylaria bambusicola]|uniref:Uncharacterized protein n=1 Tax=Xylaria bambusicola TaxID=326684 RepID=A0AAN7Z595_9PEZI